MDNAVIRRIVEEEARMMSAISADKGARTRVVSDTARLWGEMLLDVVRGGTEKGWTETALLLLWKRLMDALPELIFCAGDLTAALAGVADDGADEAGPDDSAVTSLLLHEMLPMARAELREVQADTDENVQAHARICRELSDMYARKNHDYGDSFHQTFVEEGWAVPRIRLMDKLNRVKQLTSGSSAKVADESVRDTFLDLANYAIMTVMEMDSAGGRK